MLIALAKIPEYEGTIPPEQGVGAEGSSTPEKVFVGTLFFPKSSWNALFERNNQKYALKLILCTSENKAGLSPSKKNSFYLFQWKPFKMMKIAFYFILKALFILKRFKFLSCRFGHAVERD